MSFECLFCVIWFDHSTIISTTRACHVIIGLKKKKQQKNFTVKVRTMFRQLVLGNLDYNA